jgi:hypothetical protein
MENFRLSIRAVFYQEGDIWFAHCLETDMVGHGPDKQTAFTRMNEAMAEQLLTSMEHNNPANIFQPADARFFEMFAAGKDIIQGELVSEQKPVMIQHKKTLEIEGVESREYHGRHTVRV